MATIAIQVGIAVAGVVLNAIFAPKPPTVYGSRLSDLNLTAVSPGNPMNKVYGTISVGCQCIWGTGLKETQNTTKVKGGKGGAKSQKQVTYTYSTDVAFSMCEGPITKVRRIWANSKVLYSSVIVTGPDAITVQNAASTVRGMCSSLQASAKDILDNTTLGGSAEKPRLRSLIATISSQLTTTVYPAMELAQLVNDDNTPGSTTAPLNYIGVAWKTFTDYFTNEIHPGLYEDGNTAITTDAVQTQYNNIIDTLTQLAEDMDTAAAGSADAYVDGQAQEQATSALSGLDADNGFAEAYAAIIQKQSGKATDAQTNQRYDRINVYLGDEAQTPDDIMEGHLGVGQVPAYRGTAYFVVDELQLADFGNTLPTMKAEIEVLDPSGSTTIKTIVSDLCLRSGMDPTEYDITKLTDATISGFAITQTSTARDSLQTLQNIVHYDVVESNYMVCFIDRYPKTVARLRREDMSAREYDPDGSGGGGDVPAPVQTVRGMEDELPYKIIFNYQDTTRDFSAGTCQAIRNTGNVNLVTTVDLTMALTPTDAKTAVDLAMMTAYAQRRSYKMMMPLKYSILDPGDVVYLPDADPTRPDRKIRLTGTALGGNKLMELDATDHVVPAEGVIGLAFTPVIAQTSASPTGSTTAFILDTPILTEDEDDTVPGMYVGFAKTSKGWAGGALFVDEGSGGTTTNPYGGTSDDDDEVQWSAVASNTIDIPHAITGNAFVAASPYLWDRTSNVLIAVSTPDFTPTSISEATILKGPSNSIVVNGEIMQFANVEDLTGGLFRLSDFLRGRRGTEPNVAAHASGSDVLFIDVDDLTRFTIGQSEIGLEQDYKASNVNQDIASQPIIPVTAQGNSLKPYAPCHVRGSKANSGDLTISWQPRVRQGGVWLDSQDPIIDQASERYEVDIYDGPTFKRTLAVDGGRSVVYTSGDQATDFGVAPAPGGITVRVYQLGAIIGRGFTNPIAL